MAGVTSERPLRADAQANRERILSAARDAFVEHGPAVPLDEIARRAGTGIGTLYRRFPNRDTLMRAVILDALARTSDELRQAIAEGDDPFDALVRYMHRALEIRIAAVIPALLDEVSLEDREMKRARQQGSTLMQELIDRAHAAGALRKDVTFGDIGLLVVRLSRPLPGPFGRDMNDQLAHRHLDLLINGLRADSGGELSGPAMSLKDLQRLSARSRRRVSRAK